MRHHVPMNSADEHDALTRWRRFLRFRAGQRSAIKRGFRRRERRRLNREI